MLNKNEVSDVTSQLSLSMEDLPDADLPTHLLFASEIMRGILMVLCSSFTLHHSDQKEMQEAANLLHDFQSAGGYRIFIRLMIKISTHVTSSTRDNRAVEVFQHLLDTLEDLIDAVQTSKVELMHRERCPRQNHRSCNLLLLIPLHCDVLGTAKSRPFNAISSRSCVISVAIQTLIKILIKVNDFCVHDVIVALDRLCLCRCQSSADWLVHLLLCLPQWTPNIQSVILALITKLLAYHYSNEVFDE